MEAQSIIEILISAAPVLILITLQMTTLFLILVLFMKWLATGGILFTTAREGTVKAIMRGKSFEFFIMSFKGYHLNDPRKKWYKPSYVDEQGVEQMLQKWEVVYHGRGPGGKNKYGFVERNKNGENEYLDSYYDDRPELLKYLGLYWVGWPWANSVYVYPFEWNETYTEQKTGKESVLPRAEPTDFIYVADFTYAITTSGAETKDRLPTDELTLVTVAIRNPYRALFSGEDWMRRITAAINRHVRNFVSSKGYDDLIYLSKEKDAKVVDISGVWSEEFSQPIINLSRLLPDEKAADPPPKGLRDRYGVEIRTADLQSVELSGTPEAKQRLLDSATEKYAAQQKAAAILIEGTAEADVIKKKGEREAEALKKRLRVIDQFGERGVALAGFDALQESAKGPGNTIIWAGNPFGRIADLIPGAVKKGGKKT